MIERKINSEEEMKNLGEEISKHFKGGEVLELVGDVGAGKTTFTKGLARGLGILDTVQSPTFTISRIYEGENFTLTHYDFYRLNDAGIMQIELAESVSDSKNITVVEWAGEVLGVLPKGRMKVVFENLGENSRNVKIEGIK